LVTTGISMQGKISTGSTRRHGGAELNAEKKQEKNRFDG
jgi:hypothetical protein